jgi:hypothetical protein
MTDAHQLVAEAVLAATIGLVAAGLWSVVAGRRSGGAVDHRFAVDRLILAVVTLLVVNGALGALLAVGGQQPADPLHFLYGPAAVVTLPIGWALGGRPRPDGPPTRLRRDAWLLGAALILVGLEARLFLTG